MAAASSSDDRTRRRLAAGIVMASIAGIITISVVVILGASDDAQASQLVFSSVLPLLGTWVGTVMAFYFARENLQAATESTLLLAGREAETPVSQVMIPAADFVAHDLGAAESIDDVPLSDVRAKMTAISPPSRRLPIRNSAGAVLCVIHDATLTAYAESVGQTTAALDKKLGDLLAVPEYKALVEAIGFVSEKASIADARRVMGSVKNCNDVFVTADGKRDSRASGWLTNTLLAGVQ